MKYIKPPVRYVAAHINFSKVFGSYSESKYKELLNPLASLDLERIVISKANQVLVKHSNEGTQFSENSVDRVGFFSANGRRCAVISEHSIELRLTEYDDHSHFLDDAFSFYKVFKESGFAVENPISEIELHYVDHFIPVNCELSEMFNKVTLPVGQFYSSDSDLIRVGGLSFTRILESKREKVEVLLEELVIQPPQEGAETGLPKVLPDSLSEPDPKLFMPIDGTHPESSIGKNYAIVHTAGSKLILPNEDGDKIRQQFESLYKESRLTFDKMINPAVCNQLWQVKES